MFSSNDQTLLEGARPESWKQDGNSATVLDEMLDMKGSTFFPSQRDPDAIVATLAHAKAEKTPASHDRHDRGPGPRRTIPSAAHQFAGTAGAHETA